MDYVYLYDAYSEAEAYAITSRLEALGKKLIGRTGIYGYKIEDPIGFNCSEAFANDTFSMLDYCWCEGKVHDDSALEELDDDTYDRLLETSGGTTGACPPNFAVLEKDFTISWYKHLHRDPVLSRKVSLEEFKEIIKLCEDSL